MSPAYDSGRAQALRRLGLGSAPRDTPAVAKFVSALGEEGRGAPAKSIAGRFNRQAWGKEFNYSTSDQEFSGGGTRL